MPPKNNDGHQGRGSNACGDEKNLAGIPPYYSHPHGRSYSLLSLVLKPRFVRFPGLLSAAGAAHRHYTGLAMSDALNLIKIAPPSH
jgi:hypothetical protein